MRETQRLRRGHAFLPPADVLAQIPRSTSGPLADIMIWVHWFSAAGDWWLAAMEPAEDGEPATGYGYARLASYPAGAEWGTFWLEELEQHNSHNGLVIVERDLWWTPCPFGEITTAKLEGATGGG